MASHQTSAIAAGEVATLILEVTLPSGPQIVRFLHRGASSENRVRASGRPSLMIR